MTALLLLHLAFVLLIAGFRFPDALDLVAPFPLDTVRWASLCGVLLGLGLVALRREIRAERAPWVDGRRASAWTLLVLVPAILWRVGDLSIERGADSVVIVGGVLAVVAAWRRQWRGPGSRLRLVGRAGPNLRWVLPTTLIGGAVLAVAVGFVGMAKPAPAATEWAWSLATYPIYAFFQLVFLLVLPWSLWRGEGRTESAAIVGCALLFSLVHWPNPVLLVATFAGMLVWATAWSRGAGLLPLALSMGLLGAVVAQALPAPVIGHARVGPGYVLRSDHERQLAHYDARVGDLASDECWKAAGGTLDDWLDFLHRECLGASAPPTVLRSWVRRIGNAHRARVILTFLESEEFRRKRGIGRNFRASDRRLLHSTFRPWHPSHAAYDSLRTAAAYQRAGGTFPNFVRRLYRELLRRSPSKAELSSWRDHPSAPHRMEIVRSFLARGGQTDPLEFRRRTQPPLWPSTAANQR